MDRGPEIRLSPFPRDEETHEMIVISDSRGYPGAIVHIDTFYDRTDFSGFYDQLYRKGKTLRVVLQWEIVEEGKQ